MTSTKDFLGFNHFGMLIFMTVYNSDRFGKVDLYYILYKRQCISSFALYSAIPIIKLLYRNPDAPITAFILTIVR